MAAEDLRSPGASALRISRDFLRCVPSRVVRPTSAFHSFGHEVLNFKGITFKLWTVIQRGHDIISKVSGPTCERYKRGHFRTSEESTHFTRRL